MYRNPEDESWSDEYFFESQDPLMRHLEMKKHPDSGHRVGIVQSRIAKLSCEYAVKEAFRGVEEETLIMAARPDKFGKN